MRTVPKVILTLDVDHLDVDEMTEYVHALQKTIERKKDQGFPGALMEHGDGAIWVTECEIQLDKEAESEVS